MSNDNMWEEDEAFEDKPEAAQTGSTALPASPTPVDMPHQYAPPAIPPSAGNSVKEDSRLYVEETVEEVDEEAEDYSESLSDASLRLEQGSLYKMIMRHDLFAGVDADPKAVQNVQRAIRKFAKEQMEIMLGMRQDPETATVERLEIDFPFNAVEVDVLKMLAYSASKGATEQSDKYVPSVTRTTESVPVVGRTTLNPIGGSTSPKKRVVAPAAKKALANRPAAPVKRTKLDNIIEQVVQETGVPRELLEENQLLSKPVNQLNATELEERNRVVAKRRATQVKSREAIPMPSAEQQISMVESHVPKANKLVELAMKMGPSKLLESGEK